jgi:hypothetical protein
VLTTQAAGDGGETVRGTDFQAIVGESRNRRLAGSTGVRVVRRVKPTPRGVPLAEVLAVLPTVPPAEVSEVVA